MTRSPSDRLTGQDRGRRGAADDRPHTDGRGVPQDGGRSGVPSVYLARATVRAACPGLTEGRVNAAAHRLRVALMFIQWRDERWRAIEEFDEQHFGRCQYRRPRVPRLAAFIRTIGRQRVGANVKALSRWVRRLESGGVAALVDYRGGRRAPQAAIDSRLWAALLRGVAAGASVSAMHKALRPLAIERGVPWPSLSILRERVRTMEEAARRNPYLCGGCLN